MFVILLVEVIPMKKLLVIDGNALLHRAYHALPDFKSKDGIPTNAVYGFASVLYKVREDLQPTHVCVCFDTPAPTFRDKMYKDYRAHRPEVEKELIQQFPIAREFLNAAGIRFYEQDGVEADDLIAAIARKARKIHLQTIILSGDRDLFQLIDDETFVLTPALGFSKGLLYTRDEVVKKFGLPPEKIADLKALTGDPSDNYKGVKGIGPKTAVGLIRQFGSVEKLYQHVQEVEPERIRTLLLSDKEHALLSKKLAVLKADINIPVEQFLFTEYPESLRTFFHKYTFYSLERRYFQHQAHPPKSSSTPSKRAQDQLGLF